MSQENVDVVRRLYNAAARRDEVIPFEVYAEGIIWDVSNSRRALLAMKPVYHGHEGVRQYWRETTSVFGEIDFEGEELIDAGDQVLAVIREREVGRASGAPVALVNAWVDGLIQRTTLYLNIDQARAVAERLAEEQG